MIGDVPQISNYTTTSNTYTPSITGLTLDNSGQFFGGNIVQDAAWQNLVAQQQAYKPIFTPEQEKPKVADKITRRIVKVYIMDPDENVPLDAALLYEGDEHMTDLTDQELFFEVDIKSILGDHNIYRKTLVNKKVKERVEHLEAVKIRELKMVVVEIAKF